MACIRLYCCRCSEKIGLLLSRNAVRRTSPSVMCSDLLFEEFGIECRYLKAEVEETGGPPCRYFHPKEHYERLRKGRTVASSTGFDPLRSTAKVKSFTAEQPSATHRPPAVSVPAPKQHFVPPQALSTFPEQSLVVVECLTATAVRSGPRFAESSLMNVPAKMLCCGRSAGTRRTDGNVEWLQLLRSGTWLPLVNTNLLVLEQRSRCFRLVREKWPHAFHALTISLPQKASLLSAAPALLPYRQRRQRAGPGPGGRHDCQRDRCVALLFGFVSC